MAPRNNLVSLRLNPGELAAFKSQAREAGLSQSAYVRFLISLGPELLHSYADALDSGSGSSPIPVVFVDDLNDVKNQIRMQGVNLNQITKAFNTISKGINGYKPEELAGALEGVQKNLFLVASSYDDFCDSFSDYKDSVIKLRRNGSVCS